MPRTTEQRSPRRRGPEPTEEPERGGGWSDVVNQGVELGYRVVEEQIQQGQRVAEDISRQSYGPGAMGSDLRETTERMTRYYMEMGQLWLEFVTSLVPGAGWMRSPLGGFGRREETAPVSPARGTAPPVATEIVSSRPARAKLELRPRAEELDLVTPELRALEPDKPAVTAVAFERERGGALTLRIRVEDRQPPGTYHGVVVDRRSGQPVGALSVSVT